jgi:aminocarboxymuconate-semialdehyde decarboxylase
MQDAALAIQELRRCVSELGMAGIQIGTSVNDLPLSHESFFPIFEEGTVTLPYYGPLLDTQPSSAFSVFPSSSLSPLCLPPCIAERLGACIFIHPWDMPGTSHPHRSKYWLPW